MNAQRQEARREDRSGANALDRPEPSGAPGPSEDTRDAQQVISEMVRDVLEEALDARGYTPGADPMTTATIPGLAEAIERAYTAPVNNYPCHDVALEDALGMWWYDSIRAIFDRWDCDNEECPGLPAWDDTLGDESEAALEVARDEALALFRDRIAGFAGLFAKEHPEAMLRTAEAAAA